MPLAPALGAMSATPAYSISRLAVALEPPLHRSLHTGARAAAAAATSTAATAAAAAATAAAAPAAAAVSWPGLLDWRAAQPDTRTVWGAKGAADPATADAASLTAEAEAMAAAVSAAYAAPLPPSLAECGRAVLQTADPLGKAALTFRAWRAYSAGALPLGTAEPLAGPPARPARPELVPPRRIPPMDKTTLPKAGEQGVGGRQLWRGEVGGRGRVEQQLWWPAGLHDATPCAAAHRFLSLPLHLPCISRQSTCCTTWPTWS